MKNFVNDVLKESKKIVVAGAKVIAGAAVFIIGMGAGTVLEKRKALKAAKEADEATEETEIFDGETTEEEEDESETEKDEDAE